MAHLSEPDRQAITEALADLPKPVKLLFFTQSIGCEMCLPVRQLLDEFVAASDKLTIEEVNVVLDKERAASYGVDRAPAVVLETDRDPTSRSTLRRGSATRGGGDTGIRFIGAPLGYEVSSLVEAIRIASDGDSGLAEDSRKLIATLTQPLQIQVFVTPT